MLGVLYRFVERLLVAVAGDVLTQIVEDRSSRIGDDGGVSQIDSIRLDLSRITECRGLNS